MASATSEAEEASRLHRLQVVVDLPHHSGLRALSYSHTQALQPGTLVRVPLGRRLVTGVVWGGDEDEAETETETETGAGAGGGAGAIKPIAEAWTAVPPLGQAWRALVEFAARYYQRSLGELALSVLPPEMRKSEGAALERRVQRMAKAELKRRSSVPGQPQAAATPAAATQAAPLEPLLSDEQEAALLALEAAGETPVLLHGVTGSGKTEVYLRWAARALQRGRQVLVMVPEINLTPQLEAQLRARFTGHRLVSLHSGLTPVQRLEHWLQAHSGLADVVLGTRLSIFASLPRLGLIVVDEEHDASYKQQEGARYSARDLAVYRGRLEGAQVILGSATPSLESWRQAQLGRYHRVAMPSRMGGGALPTVRLVDMTSAPKGSGSALSPALLKALQERVDRGEQSLLLLNRRGYAPVLHCTACAWKSACAHCSAWQVFHKRDGTLRCHHCGDSQRVPKACPECGNLDIDALGRGTERLEEQLPQLLLGREGGPLRVVRIDADSTRKVGSLEAQLAQVHAGDADIVVGTQMVAKGHDFRRMTLVAAVQPDAALFSSDFRAPERLFALLMQAAGRAGRDAAQADRSELWVQTWHVQHPLYQALRRHDYQAFAQSQLDERESVGLPPYMHLALLRAEGRDAALVQAFLEEAVQDGQAWLAVQPWGEQVWMYPVVPATLARVADQERLQVLMESPSRQALQAWLAHWSQHLLEVRTRHRGVTRWALDIDPQQL